MGPGLPGFGIASLFYVAAGLIAPIREVVLTIAGRSSRSRWVMVGRQFALSVVTVAAVVGFLVVIDRLIYLGYLTVARGPSALSGIPNFGYAILAFVFVVGATNMVGMAYSRMTVPEAPAIIAENHRLGRTSVLSSYLSKPHQGGVGQPGLDLAVAASTSQDEAEVVGMHRHPGAKWPKSIRGGLPQITLDVMVWSPEVSDWGRAVLTATLDESLAPVGKDFTLVIEQYGDADPTRANSVWIVARDDAATYLPVYELRASTDDVDASDNQMAFLVASSSPWLAELHQFLLDHWVGKGKSPTGPVEFDFWPPGDEWRFNQRMSKTRPAAVGRERSLAA